MRRPDGALPSRERSLRAERKVTKQRRWETFGRKTPGPGPGPWRRGQRSRPAVWWERGAHVWPWGTSAIHNLAHSVACTFSSCFFSLCDAAGGSLGPWWLNPTAGADRRRGEDPLNTHTHTQTHTYAHTSWGKLTKQPRNTPTAIWLCLYLVWDAPRKSELICCGKLCNTWLLILRAKSPSSSFLNVSF